MPAHAPQPSMVSGWKCGQTGAGVRLKASTGDLYTTLTFEVHKPRGTIVFEELQLDKNDIAMLFSSFEASFPDYKPPAKLFRRAARNADRPPSDGFTESPPPWKDAVLPLLSHGLCPRLYALAVRDLADLGLLIHDVPTPVSSPAGMG